MTSMQTVALIFVFWMWLTGLIDAVFPENALDRFFAITQTLVALGLLWNVEAWLL